MATIKKLDVTGKEVGTVQIDDAILEHASHPQSIKDYLVAIRNNARQWSANTKTRCEINRTGKKPHPQKGQGRSRQGDLAAPQYKGGGIVFGPRPKDIHTSINRKEKKAAIRTLLIEKVKAGQVYVLEKPKLKEPKTKKMASFFDHISLADRRVLVLAEAKEEMGNPHEHLVKSLRNLPKKEVANMAQVNGYEIAKCHSLVLLDSAVDQFLSMLGAS